MGETSFLPGWRGSGGDLNSGVGRARSARGFPSRCGLHRTAKALRVNYYALKKRAEEKAAIGAGDISASNATKGTAATFLELAVPTPSISTGSCECTMELENTAGAKMRVHLSGVATPDLVALSRSFYQGES